MVLPLAPGGLKRPPVGLLRPPLGASKFTLFEEAGSEKDLGRTGGRDLELGNNSATF